MPTSYDILHVTGGFDGTEPHRGCGPAWPGGGLRRRSRLVETAALVRPADAQCAAGGRRLWRGSTSGRGRIWVHIQFNTRNFYSCPYRKPKTADRPPRIG
jgi:hypothetical protein